MSAGSEDEFAERERLRDKCVKTAFFEAVEWGSVFGAVGAASVFAANKYNPGFRRCVPCARGRWRVVEHRDVNGSFLCPPLEGNFGGSPTHLRRCRWLAWEVPVPAQGCVASHCGVLLRALLWLAVRRWAGTTTKTGLIAMFFMGAFGYVLEESMQTCRLREGFKRVGVDE